MVQIGRRSFSASDFDAELKAASQIAAQAARSRENSLMQLNQSIAQFNDVRQRSQALGLRERRLDQLKKDLDFRREVAKDSQALAGEDLEFRREVAKDSQALAEENLGIAQEDQILRADNLQLERDKLVHQQFRTGQELEFRRDLAEPALRKERDVQKSRSILDELGGDENTPQLPIHEQVKRLPPKEQAIVATDVKEIADAQKSLADARILDELVGTGTNDQLELLLDQTIQAMGTSVFKANNVTPEQIKDQMRSSFRTRMLSRDPIVPGEEAARKNALLNANRLQGNRLKFDKHLKDSNTAALALNRQIEKLADDPEVPIPPLSLDNAFRDLKGGNASSFGLGDPRSELTSPFSGVPIRDIGRRVGNEQRLKALQKIDAIYGPIIEGSEKSASDGARIDLESRLRNLPLDAQNEPVIQEYGRRYGIEILGDPSDDFQTIQMELLRLQAADVSEKKEE